MSGNTSYLRHHRHSRSEDTKREIILKYILSFVVFIFMTVLSLLICAESVALNPVFLEKSFTAYEYTAELYKNIDDFSSGACKKYNIDDCAVKKVVTFKAVKSINDAYVSEKLETVGEFDDETYDFFIGNLKSELKIELERQMKSNVVEPEKAVDFESGIDALINDIVSYINSAVGVSHMDKLHSITSVADTALKIVCQIAAVIIGALIVIVSYIGEKRYRGVRYVAYSFGAVSLINAVFAVIVSIYFKSTDFVFYPIYLNYALENHVNYLILALFCAFISAFSAFTVLLAVCWKLKRKNK